MIDVVNPRRINRAEYLGALNRCFPGWGGDAMFERFKRMVRSIIGAFIELGEDPELILRQNVKDMQDQVPAMNQNIATSASTPSDQSRPIASLR